MLYERRRRRRRAKVKASDLVLTLGGCVMLAFGLVALLAGLWQVLRHLDALRWQPVPAQVRSLSADVDPHSKTARVVADLAYSAGGQRHVTDRLSFALARDRAFDAWWSRIGAALGGTGRTVQVWVNPRNPADAVFERGIRWAEVGLLLVFGSLFAGVGAGFLRFMLGSRRRRQARRRSLDELAFSGRTVAMTAVVALPAAGLGALLWRDGHPLWAAVAGLPLLLAAVGVAKGLRRRVPMPLK
jgi:hypothetical protein